MINDEERFHDFFANYNFFMYFNTKLYIYFNDFLLFNIPNIGKINNGINIYFIGDGKSIKTSNLMIDFFGKEFNKSINISLANGNLHKSFDEKSCYALSQNVALDLSDSNSNFLSTKVRLLSKEGEAKFLNMKPNMCLLFLHLPL